jgi:hypothetical protein
MTRIVSVTALVVALTALLAGTASASGKNGFFKTPNGKVYCAWGYGSGAGQSFVVCGIKGRKLKPKPKNNCAKLGVVYVGNRIAMAAKGKAHVQACAGDAGPFADPKRTKVLKAGKTWRGGGMSCTTTKSTVKCTNKSKHGFTITSLGPYQIF